MKSSILLRATLFLSLATAMSIVVGAAGPSDGKAIYQSNCAGCHGTGAAGAPKLGDAGAWAARLKTGYEAMLNSALKGKGAMAPQAGGEYSDHELGLAVVHMANQSGGKFAEPKAPAAAASAPN